MPFVKEDQKSGNTVSASPRVIRESGSYVKVEPCRRVANWEPFSKRVPWGHVSSRELSKIMDVSLNTVNNWKMREILPPPVPHPRKRGNCNWYKISTIRAWLENRPEEEIIWEWINHHRLAVEWGCETLEDVQEIVRKHYKFLEFERP